MLSFYKRLMWNLKEQPIYHNPNPITSQHPEKSDKPILDSSGILSTFEKPDRHIPSQGRVVMLGFISDLTAFISSNTTAHLPSNQYEKNVIKR